MIMGFRALQEAVDTDPEGFTREASARVAVARPAWPRWIVNKFLIPEVVFGVGALGEVGDAVRRTGGTRALGAPNSRG